MNTTRDDSDCTAGEFNLSLEAEQCQAATRESLDSQADGTNDEQNIPIELQLEQVDMDNPKMDMLEWGVRKVIPIPKSYYWETGNTDLPLRIKAWHRVVGGFGCAIKFVDRIGKPVVEATGLTESRYDYVTSTMTDKQWEMSKKIASERKLQSKARREAMAVEEGKPQRDGLEIEQEEE